jgi:hypothetical protein
MNSQHQTITNRSKGIADESSVGQKESCIDDQPAKKSRETAAK